MGVKKDEVKAFEWYEKSAKQNDSDAKNVNNAIRLYEKSIDNGSQHAKKRLDKLLKHSSPKRSIYSLLLHFPNKTRAN